MKQMELGIGVIVLLVGILAILAAPGQPLNSLIQPHQNAHYTIGVLNIILGLLVLWGARKA